MTATKNLYFKEPRKKEPKRRPQRVGESIRIEVSLILLRSLSDPRLESVSISGVEVSDDLHVAKIFYECSDEAAVKASAGFDSAKGFIRRHLAETLKMRYVPNLFFKRDFRTAKQSEIERLLKEIADEEK